MIIGPPLIDDVVVTAAVAGNNQWNFAAPAKVWDVAGWDGLIVQVSTEQTTGDACRVSLAFDAHTHTFDLPITAVATYYVPCGGPTVQPSIFTTAAGRRIVLAVWPGMGGPRFRMLPWGPGDWLVGPSILPTGLVLGVNNDIVASPSSDVIIGGGWAGTASWTSWINANPGTINLWACDYQGNLRALLLRHDSAAQGILLGPLSLQVPAAVLRLELNAGGAPAANTGFFATLTGQP